MRFTGTAAGVCLAATALAGCSGGGSGGTSGGAPSSGNVVKDGTFTLAVNSDPGSLDPQGSAGTVLFQLSRFAYDSLVSTDPRGGIVSGLASTWKVDGQTATLKLRDGITCADGSPFTAEDAAANLTYLADPSNKSPFLGTFVPAGAMASASGSTLTLTLAAPAPFVLEGLAAVPMVCKSGMGDRSVLAHETRGTGPYQLKEAVAGDHFTYTRRTGYTWGPGGASTAAAGLPRQVVAKVVASETTAANLLLSGGLSAASVLGPDAQRLQGSRLFSTSQSALLGEMWFNHTAGRPGADPAVRTALTQALDLPQVAKVLTSNQGTAGTTYATLAPAACPKSSVAPAIPAHDLAAAKKALDAAGWTVGAGGTRAKGGTPLAVTFLYVTSLGSAGSAAAELAASSWKQLGAAVTLKGQDDTAAQQTVFGSGDWDVAWLPLNVSSPDQLVPFMSGPPAPDGTNFAHIDNAAYTAGVAKASAMPGSQGCDAWQAAETHLASDADVIPFANRVVKTFGKGARFATGDVAVVPTSIRMTAG